MYAALGELHADQRAALVLVDMEGYPVQEAARILEVPPGTIKSRCARGRARLAVLLADLDTDAGQESRARNHRRPRCVALRRPAPGSPPHGRSTGGYTDGYTGADEPARLPRPIPTACRPARGGERT